MLFKTIDVDGINIFYREAGEPNLPKVVLLHGFPSSSHQYRNLIPALADKFHVIAPDYPGFGNSDIPSPKSFSYTFDKIAEIIGAFLEKTGFTRFGLYVQDYGGPVGFRIVDRHPEWLEWLIIQNTNAYEIGFTAAWDELRSNYWKSRSPESEKAIAAFLTPETVKTIYTHGHPRPELINPDNWSMDNHFLERPDARQVQFDLFFDYRTQCRPLPEMAGVSAGTAAKDDHLLGPERYLLHAGRRRGVSGGIAGRRDASAGFGPFRGRGLAVRDRRQNDRLLRKACRAALPASRCHRGRLE
jgi:pimeloyl-ACP methyl ester carboxylesterase